MDSLFEEEEFNDKESEKTEGWMVTMEDKESDELLDAT